MNALKNWIGPALCAGLLGACASPSPAPVLVTLPPTMGSVASSPPTSVQAPGTSASMPLLAVRRVGIPEYLVARRVRYRADASTLAEWPNTYWAERIEIGVSREFVSALRQQLPGWSMCETNCGDLSPALTLQVDLAPLEFLRGTQRLQARARIAVSGPGASPRLLQSQELAYDLPAAGDNAQAQAQAMSQLIQQVASAAAPLIRAAKP
jgi:uncharacterized lipoprotein YmbA